MAKANEFPAFLSVDFDAGTGFRDFVMGAERAGNAVRRQFEDDMGEIQRVINKALSKGVQGGRLDLGVSSLKQAQAEARLYGDALTTTLRSAQLLAKETGDNSTETRQWIVALEAASRAQDENRRAIDAEIATYTRLQAAMDAASDANSRLAQSYRATFAEAARMAQLEVANSRFGASIAPALSSRATDNGAGYRELEKAAQAADQYERQLSELRQQVNPLAFEQARVNKELEFAAVAFQRGDITADQLAARTQQLNASLSRMRGGFQSTRHGMVQVGQQMQDVAISFISGQRAGTVLAQQLPQLAFAASTFGGKIGQVATTLSGPWGLALVGASFLAGRFIDKLTDADEATKKTGKAVETFADLLDREKHSLEGVNEALNDYYKAKERAREIDIQSAGLAAQRISDNLKEAISIRQVLAAQLESLTEEALRARGAGGEGAGMAIVTAGSVIQSRIEENNAELAKLTQQAGDAVIDVAEQIATIQSDNAAKIKAGFAILRKEARESIKDVSALAARLTELNKSEKAALDADRASRRTPRSTDARDASLGDMIALINQLFPGARITSTTGGRHVKGSDHYAGRAIDFVPGGGVGQYSTAEVEQILEDAGVDIRRNRQGVKQIFGPGRPASKPGDHNDHFHFAFEGKAPDPERVLQAQERAAEKLRNQIERTVESVARLRGNFDEAPRDIDRAAAAVMDLDQAIADIDRKLKAGGLSAEQRAVLIATRQSAVETRDEVIPEFLTRPIRREISDQRELIDGQALLLQGRRGEYEVLQDTIDLARLLGAESAKELGTQIQKRGITEDQLDIYYRQTAELRRQSIELQMQNERQQKLLSVVDEVSESLRRGIYNVLDGRGLGAVKGLLNDLYETQKRAATEDIFTHIFGDHFERQKLKILGLDQVDETGKAMAQAMAATVSPIDELGKAAGNAADVLAQIAANDNGGLVSDLRTQQAVADQVQGAIAGSEIVVTAQKSVQREFNDALNTLSKDLLGEKFADQLGNVMSTVLKGAAFGEASSGILRSLGIKQSKTGAQIGGAIGNTFFGPVGGAVGGIIGGTIGGFFKKTPKGAATITGFDNDVGYSGSKKLREGVTALGNSVQGTLNNIVDALGGDFGNFAVSIGQRKKKFTVDPTGRGRTKGAGVQKYDSEEEATMAAIRDAILDGAVKGIREGAQRLLRAGKDLDKQLQKAVDFQGVFQRLKEHDDPVGAALDTLDREFERLKDIFKEAGASAAEYADLERLYGIERAAAIKEASARVTASLKSLYDELTIGDNGRSLRDRLSAAQAAYDPLKARVLAGDKTAYDDFASAAQSLLEIQRQFSGSQTPYFDLLDEITRVTKERIDAESRVASIAENRDTPFSSSGKATGAAPDNSAVVGAIGETNDILRNIGRMIASGSGTQFGGRLFATEPFF